MKLITVMSIYWRATNDDGIYCSIRDHSMYISFQNVLWDTSGISLTHLAFRQSLKKMVWSIFSALFREQGVLLDGANGSLNHFGSE